MDLILSHAATMRAVLRGQQALNEGDEQAIQRFMRECAPFRPVPGVKVDGPESKALLSMQGWEYAAGLKPRQQWYGKAPSATALVKQMIRDATNANMEGLTPALEPSQGDDSPPVLSVHWGALYEVIWWHAAAGISRCADIALCECGALFERTKSGQRFCPPTPEQRAEAASGLGRAQSRCAVRARNRKYMARKRGE